MKGINEFITEMSAIHNRDNDSIRKQIYDLEKQIQNNTAADKKRILDAAGVSGKNATVSYEVAMELAKLVLKADKPYGAYYFILTHLLDKLQGAVSYSDKTKEMLDKITNIFTSAAMDDLISKNKDVEKKHKEISKIADKINSKISELKEIDKQMDELSDKYPVLRKL